MMKAQKKGSRKGADTEEYEAKHESRTSNSQNKLNLLARLVMNMPLRTKEPQINDDKGRKKSKIARDLPILPNGVNVCIARKLDKLNLVTHFVNKIAMKQETSKVFETDRRTFSQDIQNAAKISVNKNTSDETRSLSNYRTIEQKTENNIKTNKQDLFHSNFGQTPKIKRKLSTVDKQMDNHKQKRETKSQIKTIKLLCAISKTIGPPVKATQIATPLLNKHENKNDKNLINDKVKQPITPKKRLKQAHNRRHTIVNSIPLNQDNLISLNQKPMLSLDNNVSIPVSSLSINQPVYENPCSNTKVSNISQTKYDYTSNINTKPIDQNTFMKNHISLTYSEYKDSAHSEVVIQTQVDNNMSTSLKTFNRINQDKYVENKMPGDINKPCEFGSSVEMIKSVETFRENQLLHPPISIKTSINENYILDNFKEHPLEVSISSKHHTSTPSCISSVSADDPEQYPHCSRSTPLESYNPSFESSYLLKRRRLSAFYKEYNYSSKSTTSKHLQNYSNNSQLLPSISATALENPITLGKTSTSGYLASPLTSKLTSPSSSSNTTTSSKNIAKPGDLLLYLDPTTYKMDDNVIPHKACIANRSSKSCVKHQNNILNIPMFSTVTTSKNTDLASVQSLTGLTNSITPTPNIKITSNHFDTKSANFSKCIVITNDDPNKIYAPQIALSPFRSVSAHNKSQNIIFNAPIPHGLLVNQKSYPWLPKLPCDFVTTSPHNYLSEINTTSSNLIPNSVKIPVSSKLKHVYQKSDATSSSSSTGSKNSGSMPLNSFIDHDLEKPATARPTLPISVNGPSFPRNSSSSFNSGSTNLQRFETLRNENITIDTDTRNLLDEIDSLLK